MSMYIPALGRFERINKRNARIISGLFFILVILILLFPLMTFPDPPPGQQGILVNLGIPDVGQGNENAPEATAKPVTEEEESEPEEEEEEEEVKPEPKPKPKKEETKPKKDVVKTEDPEAVALRKKKERVKKEREAAEKERQKEAEKKKAAKKKQQEKEAEAERQRQAAEKRKQDEADALKDMLGGGLQGGGEGKGDNNKPGNDGKLNGNPSGIGSTGGGTGTVQGFGTRGFKKPGALKNSTNKAGIVVVYVCVDKSGRILSAKKTQKGSTTNDNRLVSLAQSHAKKYKFNSGTVDKQCGTITYNFKLN